ncbi:MAG: hypothetical protein ACRYGF_12595, partial [Janthinobacterium lividum]
PMKVTLIGKAASRRYVYRRMRSQEDLGTKGSLLEVEGVRWHATLFSELTEEVVLAQPGNFSQFRQLTFLKMLSCR